MLLLVDLMENSKAYEYLNGERVVKENGLWERSSKLL
jgi:hypothetical protein